MEFVSLDVASLLLLVKFVAKRIKNGEFRIRDNPKMENNIFAHFERTIEKLNAEAHVNQQLQQDLQSHVKFLTALGAGLHNIYVCV